MYTGKSNFHVAPRIFVWLGPMTNLFRKILKCAPLALVWVLVSGCNEELKSRMASVETRLESTPEKTKEAPRLPANAAPIRYDLRADFILDKWPLGRDLLEAIVTAPTPFLAQVQDNGDVVLQGHGYFLGTASEWLKLQGFKNTAGNNWEKKVASKDLPKLEKALYEKLNQSGDSVLSGYQFIEYNGPGDVAFKQLVPISGRRVTTGNPLDFSLDDSAPVPELFVEAGGIPRLPGDELGLKEPLSYLRGGRVHADTEGRVKINNRILRGVEKKMPAGSTHLSIGPEGLVSAFDAAGNSTELGQIAIKRIKKFKNNPQDEWQPRPDEGSIEAYKPDGKSPIKTGILEYPGYGQHFADLEKDLRIRSALLALQAGLNSVAGKSAAAAADNEVLPLIVHKPLEKTAQHLKALGIAVEKTNERTTIGTGEDEADVTNALVAVLQGLRRRIAVNEENLRNADKTRDADGRLNPYRAKTISIGPKGVIVEGVDKSDFRKNYKPGDPDAGPDGNVLLSNVNKVVESAELKAAVEEYKLIRTALERLAPKHIFPDPQ